MRRLLARGLGGPLMAIALTGCTGTELGPGSVGVDPAIGCSIPPELIVDGGPGKDGIPALHNPPLVAPGGAETSYLTDTDRVIGILIDGEPIAVPLNIQWWHEIVNLDVGVHRLAITHCPLTGSTLAFDRGAAGDSTFGVSGLLYLNNLLMYDRGPTASLWPQMARGARCGPRRGTPLAMVATLEMTWAGWRSLYPDTRVVSSETGHRRNYRLYPYGDYDDPNNAALLFPMGPLDGRRPPKERVLGIPEGASGAVALPFGVLDALGPTGAAELTVNGQDIVVFWDRARRAAAAYLASLDGVPLTFAVVNGRVADTATGSTWRVDGLADGGPRAGDRLAPVAEAFVAFWFAWPAFYPDVTLWTGSP